MVQAEYNMILSKLNLHRKCDWLDCLGDESCWTNKTKQMNVGTLCTGCLGIFFNYSHRGKDGSAALRVSNNWPVAMYVKQPMTADHSAS